VGNSRIAVDAREFSTFKPCPPRQSIVPTATN
jgi:hypothetical protein